jgi:AraC-like DNA-binding protein
MLINNIQWKTTKPPAELVDFVDSFWMLENTVATAQEVVVLPDDRFDIIFSYSLTEPYHVMFMGLGTEPDKNEIPPNSIMFAIGFKLLAVEYLLDIKAGAITNNAHPLPIDFWGITKNDLADFDNFCIKVTAKMLTLIKPNIDSRKQQLFDLIYTSNGALSVQDLADKVFWSRRQINRYFNEYFGISLKAYCDILRFRTSLPHIKEGKLYPEQDFTDQNHFIKDIKKFSGVVPKELFKNPNGRFLLFYPMPQK